MSLRIVKAKVWKYTPPELLAVDEPVAPEELLAVSIDGDICQFLLYLPGQEKDLALGFLFSSGFIGGMEDIRTIEFYPPDPEADKCALVEVRLTELARARGSAPELPVSFLRESCGGWRWSTELLSRFPPPNRQLQIKAGDLTALMAILPQKQEIFQRTGATHALAVADVQGYIILSAEDVGRHNAFDKVIGQALLEGITLHDKIALLSGRVSYEMVFKAARAGIPLLAAVSAPTHLAIRLAEALGLTLAGFVRGSRMNIYSHPERFTDLPAEFDKKKS
ncbi:MAG: formate dehydrogenase accessory sulfurtransferase FdhD [Desulfobacteraceae bacterium]